MENKKLNLEEIRALKQLTYGEYCETNIYSYYELYHKLIDLEVKLLNAKATKNAKREWALRTKNVFNKGK